MKPLDTAGTTATQALLNTGLPFLLQYFFTRKVLSIYKYLSYIIRSIMLLRLIPSPKSEINYNRKPGLGDAIHSTSTCGGTTAIKPKHLLEGYFWEFFKEMNQRWILTNHTPKLSCSYLLLLLLLRGGQEMLLLNRQSCGRGGWRRRGRRRRRRSRSRALLLLLRLLRLPLLLLGGGCSF